MSPTYWFFLRFAQLVARLCFSLKVIGRECLPRSGGYLLAMNHQSYLDPPVVALAADPRPIYFLARKTLLNWPILGGIFPRLNVVPVDQERPDMSALKNVIRLLRAGETTIVFPEGARTLDGELQPAQPGIGLIIAKTLVRWCRCGFSEPTRRCRAVRRACGAPDHGQDRRAADLHRR